MVANLARPGGNVTGVSMLGAELDAKRLELLLQAVPKARRVGVLDPGRGYTLTEVQRVADGAGVQLRVTPVAGGEASYRRAFDAMTQAQVDALLVPSFPRFYKDARTIIDLAAAARIPAIYEWPSMADDGGLMAYGPTFAELERARRLVRAANPERREVRRPPIEQPSKFELVVNLRTAKSLGLTFRSRCCCGRIGSSAA